MSRTPSMSDSDERALAAFEADLERLLAVEPSGEFAARVRTRIAADTQKGDWRLVRLSLAVAAAATLIFVLTARFAPVVRESARQTTAGRHDIHLANPAVTRSPDPSRQTASAVPQPIRAHPEARRAASEAEVIIDPSVGAAIRRLTMASRSSGTLDPVIPDGPKPVTPEPDALAVAEPLRVPELVLKPADQVEVR